MNKALILQCRFSTNKRGGLLIMVMACLYTVVGQAKENSHDTKAQQLIIEPSVCVLENKNDHCTSVLRLKLSRAVEHDFCVLSDTKESTKQCYQSYQADAFTYPVNTQKTVIIVVEDKFQQKVIAEAIFKITQYLPVNKRKRRRYGWNLL